MARRFYDSGLIQQRWYMELKPKHKALYIHLLCACDNAGIFEFNPIMMSAFIGEQITEDDVYRTFGGRVSKMSESKGILCDFVYFQCGGVLKEGVRPHDAIIKRLAEVDITVEDLMKLCTHDLKFVRSSGSTSAAEPVQTVVAKKLASEPSRKQEDFQEMFGLFWSVYPRHDSKQVAFNKFNILMRDTKSDEREKLLGTMIDSINKSRQSEQWTKDDGKFIPMPSTWLNQHRWEDEGFVGGEPNEPSVVPSAKVSSILGSVQLS